MKGAGGGRPAKPAGQTVNPQKPTHELVVLPAEGRQGAIPECLPYVQDQAFQLWEHLWRRPEAAMWSESDISGLSRYCYLTTDTEAIHDPRLLAEMRQLEDRYGLNPYARRQMRWVVGDGNTETEEKPTTRRAHLRVADSA